MASIASLLEDTRPAAYWLGLLMADGHVSEKRIKFGLKTEDRELVDGFGVFIGARPASTRPNGKGSYTSITRQEPSVVRRLRRRFDINADKTYRPPTKLPYKRRDLLRCFLVGFIDGDGSICKQSGGRRDAFVRVKLHSSWESFQRSLAEAIEAPFTLGLTKAGYSELRFCDNVWLAQLKRDSSDLPRLKRKWKKIDENFKPKRDLSRVELARQLLLENASYRQINQTTGMSFSQISNTRRRMGLPPRKRGANV